MATINNVGSKLQTFISAYMVPGNKIQRSNLFYQWERKSVLKAFFIELYAMHFPCPLLPHVPVSATWGQTVCASFVMFTSVALQWCNISNA